MKAKYFSNKVIKILLVLWILLLACIAGFMVTANQSIEISLICMLLFLMILIFIVVILKKESNEYDLIIEETELKSRYDLFKYSDIKKVNYDHDKIQLQFKAGNLELDYDESLLEKLQRYNLEITKRYSNNRLVWLVTMTISSWLVFCFYHLGVLIMGINHLIANYQIIDYFSFIFRIIKIIIPIIMIFLLRKITKYQKVYICLGSLLLFVLVIASYTFQVKTYQVNNDLLAATISNNKLNLYQNVYQEYGKLDYQIENVSDFEFDFTITDYKILKYIQNGEIKLYTLNAKNIDEQKIKPLLNRYTNQNYKNNQVSLTFNNDSIEVIYKNRINQFNQYRLIDDRILELIDNGVRAYLEFVKDSDDNESRYLQFIYPSGNELNSELLTYQKPINIEESQPITIPQVTKIEKPTVTCKEAISLMDEIIASGVENFESNNQVIKIPATSSDYNQIVLEVAKAFTIMDNNKTQKIDTQILKIVISSGDINEFGASVFDRQDIYGSEKITNDFNYRIKKVGDYYLASRISIKHDPNIGLQWLDQPITTDTSWTTDYMYRIEGKKYIGNSW
ncbi:hypothetical protein [Thomasclavelia sp.]|uniref:hypothetical protein n=1 Tax=Thomasclavelia sp. TaxID=3025757 RepID=UPI0025D922A2|nr:hypothetical protein [Thomasclavelia sp.]